MPTKPTWYYDEYQQIGTDYASTDEVRQYDQRMHKLRDIESEVAGIIDTLALTPESTLIELGCGTCELGLAAARHAHKVHAVDISPVMLDYAKSKAQTRGVTNIDFHNAGFLTYQHTEEPADAVVTQLALHHLPDFWKVVALSRIHQMLKPGGKLYLRDVVFSFDIKDYAETIDAWIAAVGPESGENCRNHIRDEYSTMSWLIEEMLRRTGFEIEKAEYTGGLFAAYLCVKKG